MGTRLGKYIKEERRNKMMSVQLLCKKSGISKSYLDYIESGVREPQVYMLVKIAIALEIPLKTMIDIQKSEQVDSAIARLRAKNAEIVESKDGRVEKSGIIAKVIDEAALDRIQASFRSNTGDKYLINCIENSDLKAIAKTCVNLPDKDLKIIKNVIASIYPDAFNDK